MVRLQRGRQRLSTVYIRSSQRWQDDAHGGRGRPAGTIADRGERSGRHSLRIGRARELGGQDAELQQAGGWYSPTTPGVHTRREAAARGLLVAAGAGRAGSGVNLYTGPATHAALLLSTCCLRRVWGVSIDSNTAGSRTPCTSVQHRAGQRSDHQ